MLQSQKLIIDELILREPEKVKKLKMQRNELIQREDKLKNELDKMDWSNQMMQSTIENLQSELRQEKAEKDAKEEMNASKSKQNFDFKSAISEKDMEEARLREELQRTQTSLRNLDGERFHLKQLQAQNEEDNQKLRDEIADLKGELEVKRNAQKIQENECESLKETVSLLFESELKAKADANEKGRTVCALKEELLGNEIKISNLEQQITDYLSQVSESVVETAIVKAKHIIEQDKLMMQMENEKNAFKSEVKRLEANLKQAETRISDCNVLLQETEAKAEKNLNEAQLELNEAEKKRKVMMEMLQAAVNAKDELIKVNLKMKEEVFIQDERIAEMEEKIQSILHMSASDKKTNEALVNEITWLEDKMKNMENEMSNKKNKKNRFRRFFATFRQHSN